MSFFLEINANLNRRKNEKFLIPPKSPLKTRKSLELDTETIQRKFPPSTVAQKFLEGPIAWIDQLLHPLAGDRRILDYTGFPLHRVRITESNRT